ncbi:MAG: PAS domain S-box protein [Flavobacterium sp.]|nr:PAS domain S-box protein [Flavobacterium sp.]
MVENIKILILEDNQSDVDLLQRELKKSELTYTSEIVQTRRAFENGLENFKPDLILADYSLSSFDGVTAFMIKQNTYPDIPFIIVSGVIGEEKAVELIKKGVTDYVLKDKLFVLIPKIIRALKESEEKKEKIITDEELVFQYEEKEKLLAELILANKELNQSAELLQENLKEISNYKYALDESTIIAITDQKGIIEKANSNFCKISKYSEEELIGQNHRIINSGYHTKEFIRDLWVTIANGKIWKGELKNKAKDGTFYWVDTTIVPFLNKEGKPYQYLAIRVDITDRKEAEEDLRQRTAQLGTANKELVFQYEEKEKLAAELIIVNKELVFQNEESEKQFEAIFNDAPMGIAIIDSLTGNLFNVNPMFAKIMGRTIAEMTNIDWMSITHPDDIQLDLNNMAQLLAREINGYRMEKRYIHPDGSYIWINMTVSRILHFDKSHPRHLCMIEDITERKRADQELIIANKELKQANQRFDLIGEATNDGLWDFNLETNQIWGNEMHQQLYGLSLADPVPNYGEWKQRIHPEDRERVVKALEETMASERNNCITEYRFNTQNIGWMNVYGRTLIKRNKEGKPVRLIGSMMDITERKKNERELAKNENHLRVILQSNPECIKLIGTNGELEDINPAGLAMIEVDSFEQIKGKSLFDIIDKPYRNAFSQLTQDVFKGKSGNLEFEITGLKGTHRWMETHAVPLKDAEEKIIFLLGTTRDITERKKTEKEILRVIERYDMIAKATSDTIWDWDITNDKILYNEGITIMFGYKKTKIETISGWWKNKIHPDDLQIVLEAIAAAFKKHSCNLYLEYRFRCADESFKYIYDRAFIIYDKHMKPYRLIGAMQDVSKLKQNEVSLNELNDNLQKQNKELAKTNTELDRFVYSVSHDLRSPLTSILGLISFIEEESRETDTLEHIKMIRNSINRLDMFIKNILNYSRNNRAELEVENIPLQKTAMETVNSLHSMKEAKGIHFEIDIKELQPFYSDRLRFNTVLENLVSNAIKYHENYKSDSYIKITGQSDHEKLQLIIADNGTGIEPAHHNKIFDMFFRLSGKTDGSGIGLYIVKETVDILQGSIQIQSEKGIGTIFTITLKNLKP